MNALRSLSPARRMPASTLWFALFTALLATPVHAQKDIAGETKMRLMLAELNNLGSVMMIAAHPDDENTALLAYLARGRHVRAAYLSLTRGEGGQNLIGSEQGDELGIVRTEELLAARRIDGGEQYFTRAIDFGFTKTVEETLGIKWPREKLLGDVVWAIRRFQPDVIVLRFSGTPRDGHGHHQASAILGKEAFAKAAADPSRFPEQLKYVKTWQAQRLMTNLAAFTPEQLKEAEKIPDKLALDLGAYAPELGYSYNEIAGMSRSQHRSQGMGTAERKGAFINYFVTDRGDKATKDIFESINIGWSRLEGGAEVTAPAGPSRRRICCRRILEALLADSCESAPADGVGSSGEQESARRKTRLAELDEAIALAGGVAVEALSDKPAVTPGGNLKVTLTALARNPGEVRLLGAKLSGMQGLPVPTIAPTILVLNKPIEFPVNITIPGIAALHAACTGWCCPRITPCIRCPDLEEDRAIPKMRRCLSAGVSRLQVGSAEIMLTRPVERRFVDRVYGELNLGDCAGTSS